MAREPVPLGERARRLADRAWPARPRTWREVPTRLRSPATQVLRLTVAAVLAWLIAQQVTGQKHDLTGPLTALLVLQATAFSTLKMGLLRVLAVLAGVLVAVAVSTLAGLTWWSLGAVIAVSLVLARALRLGEQALEVPISAMLILAVTAPDVVAEYRVVHTLIGAGVGVLFNLLVPAAVPTRRAASAVLSVSYAAADCLDDASRTTSERPLRRADVAGWLDRARGVGADVAFASSAVSQVEEGRKLNPRAIGTSDVGPVLRSGLERLESTVLQLRALFAAMLAEVPEEGDPDPAGALVPEPFDEDVRGAFAVVLSDIADCIRAFGQLVLAESERREPEAEEALATSLEILRETRAILTELLISKPRDPVGMWMLRGTVLAAVEQVLLQLDLERRSRLRAELHRQSPAAVRARTAVDRAAAAAESLPPRLRRATRPGRRPGRAGRR
ncbi:MAG TPA: FUSC family protein [Pedococcus sp.]|jgi:hypothetical protein